MGIEKGTQGQEPTDKGGPRGRIDKTMKGLDTLFKKAQDTKVETVTNLAKAGTPETDIDRLIESSGAAGGLHQQRKFIDALTGDPDVSAEVAERVIGKVIDVEAVNILAQTVETPRDEQAEVFEELTGFRDDREANPKIEFAKDLVDREGDVRIAENQLDQVGNSALSEGVSEEMLVAIVQKTAQFVRAKSEITLLGMLNRLSDSKEAQELWQEHKRVNAAAQEQTEQQQPEQPTHSPSEETIKHPDPLEEMLETRSDAPTQLQQKMEEEDRILDSIASSRKKSDRQLVELVEGIEVAEEDSNLNSPTEENKVLALKKIWENRAKLLRDWTVGLHDAYWTDEISRTIGYDGKDPQKAQFLLDLWTRKQEHATKGNQQPDDNNNSQH